MITIIRNDTCLSDEDLATAVAETMETNEMYGGLWGIKVRDNGDVDCSFMFRTAVGCNALIDSDYPIERA